MINNNLKENSAESGIYIGKRNKWTAMYNGTHVNWYLLPCFIQLLLKKVSEIKNTVNEVHMMYSVSKYHVYRARGK